MSSLRPTAQPALSHHKASLSQKCPLPVLPTLPTFKASSSLLCSVKLAFNTPTHLNLLFPEHWKYVGDFPYTPIKSYLYPEIYQHLPIAHSINPSIFGMNSRSFWNWPLPSFAPLLSFPNDCLQLLPKQRCPFSLLCV